MIPDERFECTAAELAVLAGLLGADVLFGLPDPFAGWLAEEVEQALAHARSRLEARGWVTSGPDGTTEVAPRLAAAAGACVLPGLSFGLAYTRVGEPPVGRYFHLVGAAAVELSAGEGADAACSLTVLGGPAEVSERITHLLPVGQVPGPQVVAGVLPTAALSEARRLADTRGAAQVESLLRSAGLEPRTAAAFAAALAQPLANGALIAVVRRSDGWETEELGFLEAGNGLWRLSSTDRGGGEAVAVAPWTPEVTRVELAQLVGRYLAAEVVLT